MNKYYFIILMLIANCTYATDGEYHFYIQNINISYQFKFEKIPNEYYYDENYQLAIPPDFIFTRNQSEVIRAAIVTASPNGHIDDNGNRFELYFGEYKA